MKKIPEIFGFNGVIDGAVDFNSKALRGSLDCSVDFSTEFEINSEGIMGGFLLEQWHWWTITLLACTFAFAFSNSKPVWAAVASTIVGGILWFRPDFPAMYQIGIFVALTVLGTTLTSMLYKGKPSEDEATGDGEPKRVLRVDRLIGHVITLETPIVNGNGQFEIQGVTLRLRGADTAAGEKVRVTGVDGIDRELVMVEPLEGRED